MISFQSRAVGNVDVAVHHLDRVRDDLLLPRLVELVEDFVDEEVRRRGVQLHAGRRADRALCAVRGDHAVVRVHHAGDHAGGEQAAEVQRLGLQDIDAVVAEQFGELLLGGEALAGGDGDRAAPRDLDHRVDVGVRHRLLEPGRAELLHGFGQLDGGRNVEARVAFDQQVHGVAHRVAHGADDVHREVELAPRERPPVVSEGIELERGVAARRHRAGPFGEALGRARAAVPAVGVGPQLLVTPADLFPHRPTRKRSLS
jgi:hypothetical protein